MEKHNEPSLFNEKDCALSGNITCCSSTGRWTVELNFFQGGSMKYLSKIFARLMLCFLFMAGVGVVLADDHPMDHPDHPVVHHHKKKKRHHKPPHDEHSKDEHPMDHPDDHH